MMYSQIYYLLRHCRYISWCHFGRVQLLAACFFYIL